MRYSRRYSTPMKLARNVTMAECGWLYRDFAAGEVLYTYPGPTYGSVDTERGIAMCEQPGGNPFFEIPRDALEATS
jgi:hypothetical protein